MSVSVVIPTYNRRAALEVTLPAFLAMRGADEVVVVVDGSTDGTSEWLAGVEHPRLRVVAQANAGAPAARNAGVRCSRGEWLLMADDDCLFPPDYLEVVEAERRRAGADIVGAPWVNEVDPERAAARAARSAPVTRMRLDTPLDAFPADTVATPFLIGSGGLFVRRAVLDVVPYDTTYTANAWREETDFAIRAIKAGFVSVLTPRTYTTQAGYFAGGQRRSALLYEWATAINNWRFLRRHGRWLRAHGHVPPIVLAQAALVATRARDVVGGGVRARLRGSRRASK